MVTFTINIPPMLAYIPYMDPIWILASLISRLETAAGEAGKPDQSSPTISIYWESNRAMENP